MRRHIKSLAAGSLCALMAASACAKTEIVWWHSMTGALGDRAAGLADKFNKSQHAYKITPVFKGSYDEAMTAAIAGYRAGKAPNILQVPEVGTAAMLHSKGAIVPVSRVMQIAGEKFNPAIYVPALASYYMSPQGAMLSFPFNSSTAVFYYNKDMFAKAGLDPDKAPVTWPAVLSAAAKLKVSGEECAYTSGWQSWVHLENFSAWHNVEFASGNNGFAGNRSRLKFNSPLHVKHIDTLANWARQGYFTYAGPRNEAEAMFYSGECAMLTSSSAAYANIRKNSKFRFGVAALPYYARVHGAPQNTIVGGTSLWVMSGKKTVEYKAVARFFKFLSRPEIQAKWHQETGYLPLTTAAYELTKKSGFYENSPGQEVAVRQMLVTPTPKSRGIRLGNFVRIRAIIDEELELAWSGKKTAKDALDTAVKRGNELLVQFEKGKK
ncbi:sn-glycerol-3-phosphate ABC transporter substrate-binding protein UgpB [Noviherbaspirillum sp.]|uniref:sn-glycerol-3-phosphate ABC transporter substrate-binding protein UgpB n=1 Tax=Noviherbaspirillum sp. TaxID=1926288 RepID=UPI002B47E44A|nr:sn-glycerol-3-phosphate ABC transporter substrate-binding protein UgpB [Noviherbaspirillum sp.]HJV79739.1 sn-glycerol-3-phosphate ABC transporter substrate-binding protein UgpB [Noviherbaspirillum sp.]